MSLNIKNASVYNAARRLAQLSGETMTQAVGNAIEERLDRLNRQRNQAKIAAKLLLIGRDCAALPLLDSRSPDEILYDRHGLPK